MSMQELKGYDYYVINDDSEILRHRYEKQLAYLQCLEPLMEVEDTRYFEFLDPFRSEKHPDIVKPVTALPVFCVFGNNSSLTFRNIKSRFFEKFPFGSLS